MADYTTLQGVNPNNVREMMRQDASFQSRQNVTGEPFSKALGVANDVMSLAGPVVGAAAPFMGMKGGAITSAALSGVPMQGGGISTPGYSNSKFLAPPGGAPGFPGAGGGGVGNLGGAPGFPGGGGGVNMNAAAGGNDPSQFNSQIDSMMNNNLTMLALQTKVQNVSQMSQMMSNIAKTDADTKLNAIRNVKS